MGDLETLEAQLKESNVSSYLILALHDLEVAQGDLDTLNFKKFIVSTFLLLAYMTLR